MSGLSLGIFRPKAGLNLAYVQFCSTISFEIDFKNNPSQTINSSRVGHRIGHHNPQ